MRELRKLINWMIDLKFNDKWCDDNDVGKLLLMSIAILSGEGEYRKMTPDEIFDKIKDLANKVFHEEEWNEEEKIKNRLRKIENIESDLPNK